MKKRSRIDKVFGNTGPVLHAVGLILAIAGFITLTPLLFLFISPEESVYIGAFLFPACIFFVFGIFLVFVSRNGFRNLNIGSGSIVVTLSWIIVSAVSAIPIQRLTGLPYLYSFFESVSGWTTTGLSVVDVSLVPKILLIWRSIMQFAGGAGLAIIMLAVTSLPVGAGLYQAEGRNEQLVPHVIHSAKLVVLLYSTYAFLGIAAYIFAGMSVFDAVNHSFCAVSTGGFSTRPESIGYWDSCAIEAVTIVLMILGNMNFLTAYVLFRGKLKKSILRDGEFRVMIVLLTIAFFLIFFQVTPEMFGVLGKKIRVAVFEAVSALTTTGYSTASYTGWPPVGFLVLIVLMFVGGGTCSTAGGIKQFRIYILSRAVGCEIRKILISSKAVTVMPDVRGERKVFINNTQIRQAGIYIFLYLSVFILGTGILTMYGFELKDAMFEYASTLGTVGLSVGITGADLPAPVVISQIIGMLLGRLEFFVAFAAVGRIIRNFGVLIRGS